ncbi:ecdysteroid 22-kinase family protein [Mycobacterium sp. MYCO198283]|uniref:phosphotransferase family protein n=1 Tax=Mycobacterium sp. MYCO198283 TaxID=2883505 RepID=UPI001E5B99D7|nr:ecdysteroid 22-kinase family protein [Mycobacterium sp. MYCO198283]MCG5433057.1 ecdysteroid 22-kinase family protein [Mycobacterium sp. MYCO198283]
MTAASTIPGDPSDVTAEWLGGVLSTADRRVEIAGVDVTPVGTGQTGATYRASVRYAAGSGGLPASFVVKLPSQDPEVRARVALGYRSEYTFYTQIADTVSLPMPHCYHCEIADDGAQFALVLADLAPAEQGDQLAGCTPAEARLAVTALAGLHGPRWCDPAWLTFPGLVMGHPDEDTARGLGDIARMATDITLERLGGAVSAADRETLDAATSLITPWLLLEPGRYSVLHGDYRLDNLLFDPDRTRVTVVDWQTLAVGLPARDLAYFTATSLQPADRARAERDLVAAYHDALRDHGVTDYGAETCWRDYRLGMLQAPLITTLGFAFSAATERGDDMVLTMLRRSCTAIRELGTVELVRESAPPPPP